MMHRMFETIYSPIVPKPEILSPPQKVTVQRNKDAIFHCYAFSHGRLDYDWKTKSGSSLPPSAVTAYMSMPYRKQIVSFWTLTISKVRQSQSKQYCCVATSEGGTVEHCASLVVY